MPNPSNTILFVSLQEAPWAGSEWLWAESARALQARGERIAFALRWQKDHPLLNALRHGGAAAHAERAPTRWYRRLMRRRPFADFVLFKEAPCLTIISQGRQDEGLEWAEACLRAGLPYTILNQLTVDTLHIPTEIGERMTRAFLGAKALWFVSENNLHSMELQLGTRLPLGRRVQNPYRTVRGTPFEWPQKQGMHLALAGRLDPEHKGQDLMMKVLSAPKWQERDIWLHCYGSGTAGLRLRRLASTLGLGRFSLEGHVDEVSRIWGDNHVVCQPSRAEGTPITMIEGMLAGRPVLGTRVSGIAEYVEDGHTGFLADAPTLPLLDAALERLWEHRSELQGMGLQAYHRVRELVDPDPVGRFATLILETAAHATPHQ